MRCLPAKRLFGWDAVYGQGTSGLPAYVLPENQLAKTMAKIADQIMADDRQEAWS